MALVMYESSIPDYWKKHRNNDEYLTHKSNSFFSHIDIGGVSANRNIETMIIRRYIKPSTLFLNDLGIGCA